MARKRRRRKYSFKPRFYIIVSVFILLVFASVKLIVSLISGIDTIAASNIIKGTNNYVIAIDSGHDSQTDKGAVSASGVYEYLLNDGVSKALQKELTDRGYSVIQTRELDSSKEMTLNERALLVNQTWPDLLVSIHHNANTDTSVKGYSIIYNSQKTDAYNGKYIKYKNKIFKIINEDENYIYFENGGREKRLNTKSQEGKYEIIDLSAEKLVQESINVSNDIYETMKLLDFVSPLSSQKENVIIDLNLQILRQTHCVGICVECGFVTNESEVAQLVNEEHQKQTAEAIADGIDKYFGIEDNKESN